MRIHLLILSLALTIAGCPSSSTSSKAADGGAAGSAGGSTGGAGNSAADGGSQHDAGGGSTGTGGAGCELIYGGMVAGCVEYQSANDYATAKGVCTSHGSMWLTACPTAGRIGGCKVPPGAAGGAPGGTIRWSYMGNVSCSSGETKLDAQGAVTTSGDADAAAALPVGPGGPISSACKMGLMAQAPLSTIYGVCTPDSICNACITTDYAAKSCQTSQRFQSLLSLACVNPSTMLAACKTECGK